MSQSDFRNKTRLKRKEIRELEGRLSKLAGSPITLGPVVEKASYKGDKFHRFGFGEVVVFVVEKDVIALEIDNRLCFSLKGTQRFGFQRLVITVDMGAVKFLYNGADVMAPGIVGNSGDFEKGDFVWVRDERNRKALALGIALVGAAELEGKDQGKAVRTFHHIGDFIWSAQL